MIFSMIMFSANAIARSPAVEPFIEIDATATNSNYHPSQDKISQNGYKFTKHPQIGKVETSSYLPVWMGIIMFFSLPMFTWYLIYRKHTTELATEDNNIFSLDDARNNKTKKSDQNDDEWKQAS